MYNKTVCNIALHCQQPELLSVLIETLNCHHSQLEPTPASLSRRCYLNKPVFLQVLVQRFTARDGRGGCVAGTGAIPTAAGTGYSIRQVGQLS